MKDELVLLDETSLEDSKHSKHGQKPHDRGVEEYIRNGFVILDKPAGPTSHEIVATIKKILGLNKAGHSGTLDPNVTGVLPIGLENATKALTALVGSKKRYICNLSLNAPIEQKPTELLQEFVGEIYQVPPLKSNVVRKLRTRQIYEIKVLDQQDQEILFDVYCQAGTYIRTLCVDVGRASGLGGYMKELRRISTGPFDEEETVSLHDVFDAYHDYLEGISSDKIYEVILPVERMVEHIPQILLKDNAVDPICHGAKLGVPGISAFRPFKENDLVALMSGKGELIAIGEALISSDILLDADYGFVVQPSRVLMQRGLYPKYEA
jgi:H/ACA ribonucleoprotein complex subunit 4